MEKLVSIIVPIYNVEKYIKKCVDSIINQTYKNIEILLIDDGSTDNCGYICDEYEKKDKRIKVFHKENGGLSDARNYGLKISNGEYISFIDSDDFVDKKFIEILYDLCKNNNCKIAQCEFCKFEDENNTLIKEERVVKKIKTKYEMLKSIYQKEYVNSIIACNKLYKKELFKNIQYTKGKINEDESTTYKLFLECDKIACTNQKLYFYRQRQSGITKSKFSKKNYDYIEAMEERLNIFKKLNEEELYSLTLERFFYGLITFYYSSKKNLPDEKQLIDETCKKMKKTGKELLNLKYTNRHKLYILFLYFFPKSYILLNRIKAFL